MLPTMRTAMIKSAILALLDHKDTKCIELPVRKIWLFSHLHILLYCFLFEWRGKRNKNFLLIVQFQGTESQEILHE